MYRYPSKGFLYTSMVYGKAFFQYIKGFIRNFLEKVGKMNLVLFTLDE